MTATHLKPHFPLLCSAFAQRLGDFQVKNYQTDQISQFEFLSRKGDDRIKLVISCLEISLICCC